MTTTDGLPPLGPEGLKQVLRCLEMIHNHQPLFPDFGICGNLFALLPVRLHFQATQALRRIWEAWPEYSGIPACPVPGEHGESPTDTWMRYAGAEWSLWGRETEYGRARWRLLAYLIAELRSRGVTTGLD